MSVLFGKSRKEAPKDELAKNATFLVRGGFVDKLSAGVYSYLPLGLAVLRNIETIIREEMDSLGAQEVLLPSLHPKENWMTTGRWESVDDLYTLKDASEREFALGGTHEEVVVPLAKQFITSYRDLPKALYQIQNKFRMELRAKSGLLRGREFLMKDLYSFHADEADLDSFYERVRGAYERIFERVGLGAHTHFTYASGGTFSEFSHEFQALTEAGEDIIYLCRSCSNAVNKEIFKVGQACPDCGGKEFEDKKAIEVGNIFKLKTKFTESFDLTFTGSDGAKHYALMGCFGIGLGRLLGTIVEIHSDDKGIMWPESVAPYRAHLISLSPENKEVSRAADELYEKLKSNGSRILYDDRDIRIGEKFNDADLIGIPVRLVVSEKTLLAGEVEKKLRSVDTVEMIKLNNLASLKI